MAKQRFDNKPMNRAANAAGDVNAVLLKQEVDPSSILEVNRRHGSVRVADQANSLGIVVEGQENAACWFSTEKLTASASWSIGFSLKVGQHLDPSTSAKIPIITVQHSATQYWELYSKYISSSGCKLYIDAQHGSAVAEVATDATRDKGSVVDVVLTYSDADDKFKVYVSDDYSSGSYNTGTLDAKELTLAPTASNKFTVEVLGNSLLTTNKVAHLPHVVTNLTIYTGVLDNAAINALFKDRTPATSNLQNHYLLTEGGQAVSSEVAGGEYLLCDPSPPVTTSDSVAFNGRSSVLRVQLTSDIEQYFTASNRAALFATEYTFMIAGTVLQNPADGAQILLDFNDLGVLSINTSGYVVFTVSGTSNTFNDAALSKGSAFTIFASKNADRVVELTVNGLSESSAVTIPNATWLPPYIDYDEPAKLWLGADGTESEATNFQGVITKFAMYPEVVVEDLGPVDECLVYMAGNSLIDKTKNNVGLLGLAQTDLSAVPGYVEGPLADADHVAVVGGHVLGEGVAVGLTDGTQRMSYKFKKDAEALRIGSKLLIASNSVGHVLDEESESLREYGVPSPWRNVSVKATAPGVLEGAASYGYRYVTADGTYGPIRRLDPAAITSTAGRFIIGSSAGAPIGSSELGETFMKCAKGSTESAGTEAGTYDILGTTANSRRIVMEVFAKVEEIDEADYPEVIWERGLEGVEGKGGTNKDGQYFVTERGIQIDLNSDFAAQVSFKYKGKAFQTASGGDYSYVGFNPAQGVFAIGDFSLEHRRKIHSRASARNPSICAWLQAGYKPGTDRGGNWYHRTTHENAVGNTNIYGGWNKSGAFTEDEHSSPRLVVALGREEFEHSHVHYGISYAQMLVAPGSNLKVMTFTDATELVGGSSEDESIWQEDHDYSLFVVRDGSELKVYVNDATEAKWYTLAGRTMNALQPGYLDHGGLTSGTYTAATFFDDWTDPTPSDSHQMTVKSIGEHTQDIPTVRGSGGVDGDTTNGQVTNAVGFGYPERQSGMEGTWGKAYKLFYGGSSKSWINDNSYRYQMNHECYPMHYTVPVFHARLWSDQIDLQELQDNAHYRTAAMEGEALSEHCVLDGWYTWPDSAEEKDAFEDGASSGMLWISKWKRSARMDAKVFQQEVDYATAVKQPILMWGNAAGSSGPNIGASNLALYYSTRGRGSITLQLKNGAEYVIANEAIPGGPTDRTYALLSDYEFVNEFHEWNMYSIELSAGGPGSDIEVRGMAINGNSVFNTTIREESNTITEADGTDWITIGGFIDTDENNVADTFVGEFRIWADDEGPKVRTGEPGPNGWSVNSRVHPDHYGKMHAYYTFREDHLGAEVGLAATELLNVGTHANPFDNLTLDAAAQLEDSREPEDGTDAVAFPAPPRPDIVAIELFRTITQGIVDVDVDRDIQDSLNSVRYAPLYFVARLGSETRHYVDDAPNSTLGFAAPWTEFATPDKIKQFFTWQGQVGVIGDENRVYYTEPGPFGWETFPYTLVYEARIGGGGAGELLGCRSTGDTLYLFGRSWATALVGSPGNETEFPLGGGVGAYSARTTLDMTGMVYAFNGRLWVIDRVGQVDFKVQDAGAAFQDLLPTHDNVRLACSSELQSIFIIDENTGDALRVFTPTGEVTVEKRYAIGVGDSGAGVDQWVNVGGSYSSGNTAVYGDDVRSTSTPASDVGTLNGSVFTTTPDMSANIHTGMRVGIVDSAGVTLDTTITTIAGADVTLASVSGLTGGGAAATIYFGASADGMLIDTGYIDSGNDNSMAAESQISIQSGTGVEVGFAASPMAGTRSSIADAQFVTVATNETTVGGNLRGRFLRCILRNREPEATSISHIDMDITSPYK